MSYDLNDAQPQMAPIGELIPDGTFAKVRLTIRPGGVNGASPMDAGLLKASQSSDARMLDCEFTLVDGPHARRKFWQSFTVAGGKLDEKGQSIGWKISKSTFRAIVDSALGLDPKDESPGTKAKRVLPGLRHLEGIIFAARIMVEPASNPQYRDQNRIANVVLPDEPQHAAIMRGETVAPDPVNAPPRKAASITAPGWQAPAPAWGAAQPSPAAPNWGAAPRSPPPRPHRRGGRRLPLRHRPHSRHRRPLHRGRPRCPRGSMAKVPRARRSGGSARSPTIESGGDGPGDRPMTPDEWQAHVTRAAALEIGKWLEARGKLHQPIASLTLGDLEAMAVNAISRWIVLQSERLQWQDWPQEDPVAMILLG